MEKKIFFKIISYILSIFLLTVTIVNHIYRISGKEFSLKPSFVAILCITFYLFMDHITKDTPKFDKVKKVTLISFLLYSLFELGVLILG
ncbi:hypothetical protein HAHI6034_05850 [Hathewaya histolytica]|uniref:Uncharacterized protein n=1 Tax=Hathewaya histolytica TaxID=1498 RepID=A0A4V6KDB4_HATHI|nr:hypothetical protein [Hathewaya histolytica]VTQ89647.1 Uncharacterised protein [Hathewaya histolytica]